MSYKGETGSMKKHLRARLGRFATIAAVALCALGLLTGCGDTYYDYDGSGYFTSADGYMRVAYQEHFQQLSSVDKNAIGLDWVDEKVNLQIVRYRKDDEMFTERSVKTLDQFIELYYANGLEYLHKYSTFGDLQEFTFEHFDAAKGYDVDTEKDGKKVASRIYYLEDAKNFYVLYLNGDPEHYRAHFEVLDAICHTLEVVPRDQVK